LAIVFHFTMVRKAATADSRGAIVACVSLALWTLVPLGGIFIGFAGSTAYGYPVLLSIHVVAFVLLVGMILWTDLRAPKWIAFGFAALSGGVLFGLHAEQYAHNPWFWIKIALLVLI